MVDFFKNIFPKYDTARYEIKSNDVSYKNIYDACLKTAGKNIKTIVDLGARHGEGYELFGKYFPEASYVFVEPSEKCIPLIKKVIEKNSDRKLFCVEGILGSEEGSVEFYQFDNDDDQSGNVISSRDGKYGQTLKYKVKVHDFKKYFQKIDFLKCNIEGGEFELIDKCFFDIVDSFVLEAHNEHVPNKSYKDIVSKLSKDFVLEIWGNVNYKYCFINGTRKKL